ncbi:ATP-binding protein [Kroppenstedtia sanguinis]|uniref:ATP-binding protein n=1 Tax=Kroppenstedtia sanguinis TaxID=1380684 RepID=A0ABW4C5F9_9BACL
MIQAEIREEKERKAGGSQPKTLSGKKPKFECEKCKDSEWIWTGWEAARPCECQARKKHERRIRAAMIPDEFQDARLDTYVMETPLQIEMFNCIAHYIEHFDEIQDTPQNSLGFIAKYGEQRLRRDTGRKRDSSQYNSFGLGKTHLQVGAARELIDRGHPVLIVSDVVLMDELAQARAADDGSTEFNRLLNQVIQAKVLVWDDIGKSNPSEFKRSMYFQIINERYKARRPIIFSSNEDTSTLAERIGEGARSRLMGMAKNYLLETAGPDYRAIGA